MRFADNRNKIGKYIPAVVFLIFIYGMALWFIFSPKPDYSSSEKRYLQKFPEVTAEKLLSGDFGSEFETFFADRFPQRNTWVGLNAYTALAEGNNGASGVYNCKNGYLINKPVSTENNLDKNIGAVADFAKSIDTPTTVMLVPSTGYIVDDVLPTFHDKYNDDEDISKISSTLSKDKIGFVDLRERFKSEYKNGSQIYYKTDHHGDETAARIEQSYRAAKVISDRVYILSNNPLIQGDGVMRVPHQDSFQVNTNRAFQMVVFFI